ncbi:MAG: glycoside hydrolase family 97 protein [Muribaculaceae bacterium]|nr:glycoside hydrolase family 97 protein [Muribaculaceae bacterium]
MKNNILILALSLAGAMVAHAQLAPGGGVRVSPAADALEISGKDASGIWQPVMRIATGAIDSATDPVAACVAYTLPSGKRSQYSNSYVETLYTLADGTRLQVRVYDDGVCWRGAHDYTVDICAATRSWLMNWVDCYEEFFVQDRTDLAAGKRLGYPALLEYPGGVYMLLTESGIAHYGAGTSMWATGRRGKFELRPDGPEMPGWQTAIVGSLSRVVESSLVLDNSEPAEPIDFSWVQPGVASWIYWAHNNGSRDYDTVCSYIDLAAELGLPYTLIDADWHLMDGGHTIEDALDYAAARGVRPMIWYNSSIGWVNGAPGPQYRLNTPEDMEREFAWCEDHGIAGVKVDFFSGDTRPNLELMHAILVCAARHKLLVNFHGAPLPRGWQRTWPNLLSTEAVYGAEWYNNVPTFTSRAAAHNATLPFTRNVVGSMDYTPCAFSDSQHPHITTHAHELALTALYESGLQHLADRPESFLAQPEAVRQYLGSLPAAWDETLMLGGYPGRYAMLARRSGDRWYIAAINGTDGPITIESDYSRIPAAPGAVRTFADSGDTTSPWLITDTETLPATIDLAPRGGIVIVAE